MFRQHCYAGVVLTYLLITGIAIFPLANMDLCETEKPIEMELEPATSYHVVRIWRFCTSYFRRLW